MGRLSNAPTPLIFSPLSRALSRAIVVVWKSASAVRKHLVSALLQSAGRSTIHSADARWHDEQAAVWTALLPVVRSLIVSVNFPAAYRTEASMWSPGLTLNTFTE